MEVASLRCREEVQIPEAASAQGAGVVGESVHPGDGGLDGPGAIDVAFERRVVPQDRTDRLPCPGPGRGQVASQGVQLGQLGAQPFGVWAQHLGRRAAQLALQQGQQAGRAVLELAEQPGRLGGVRPAEAPAPEVLGGGLSQLGLVLDQLGVEGRAALEGIVT